MPIPSLLVTRFFQLLTQRSITEAERVLEEIKGKSGKLTERLEGYMMALEGALVALKSNDDRYAFILRNEVTNESINRFRNEFLRHARSEIHSDYDRGYFSAWSDYMRILSRTERRPEKIEAVKEKASERVEKEKTQKELPKKEEKYVKPRREENPKKEKKPAEPKKETKQERTLNGNIQTKLDLFKS